VSTSRRHVEGGKVELHSFLNSAIDGDQLASRPTRFSPEKEHGYPLNSKLCASEPVWVFWRREEFLAPVKIRTPYRPARSTVATPSILVLSPCVNYYFVDISNP